MPQVTRYCGQCAAIDADTYLAGKAGTRVEKPHEGRGRHGVVELAMRRLDEAAAQHRGQISVSAVATATVDGSVILRTLPLSTNFNGIAAPVITDTTATARGPSRSFRGAG